MTIRSPIRRWFLTTAVIQLVAPIIFWQADAKLELNVQVLICTDYSIYRLHESIVSTNKLAFKRNAYQTSRILNRARENAVIDHIKAYYTEIMDQVNERYRNSFKNDPYLNINIELVGFYISKEPKDSQWSEMNKYEPLGLKANRSGSSVKLNGDLALKEFNKWIETKRSELVHFDHAFGLTALDIVSNQDDIDYNGLAYIYGICKKSFSGSIIEDKGAFESVRSFAHELGHNLGADHDGLSNSECSEWENYIMASKFFPYNQLNSWLFSNCSIKKIKEYLLDFENNFCLLNRASHEIAPGVDLDEMPVENQNPTRKKIYPGEIYDSYEQCQRLNGLYSTPCFEFQSSFCENLYCHKNDSLSECVWVAPAAEGTECGPNMWCKKGKCLPKNLFLNQEDLFHEQPCPNCELPNIYEIHSTDQSDYQIFDENSTESLDSELMSISFLRSTTLSPASCEDIMDGEFCEMAYQNEYCDDMFYWNGRNIAQDWCKKHCNKCF